MKIIASDVEKPVFSKNKTVLLCPDGSHNLLGKNRWLFYPIGNDGLFDLFLIETNECHNDPDTLMQWLIYIVKNPNFVGISSSNIEQITQHLDSFFDPFETSALKKAFELAFLLCTIKKEKPNTEKKSDILTSKEQNIYGSIYVIQLDSFVKVGFTTDLKARISSYKTSNLRVELVKTYKATWNDEKAFHKKFNKSSEKYLMEAANVCQMLDLFLKSKKN
jgi:hypothetical protein